jgi:hypothetical protein
MKEEEVTKKVIEKAIKNGYKPIKLEKGYIFDEIEVAGYMVCFYKRKKYSRKHKYGMKFGKALMINDIIFSHDFAKAFWGEIKIKELGMASKDIMAIRPDEKSGWQYHLQQIVLLETKKEKINYFKKFI